MFTGNGDVAVFARDFARDVVTYSHATYRKRGIGHRSGLLDAATKAGGVLKEGPYHCRTSIHNPVPYAAAVHNGTAGQVIVPTHSRAMPVPKIRGAWGPTPRFPVGPTFAKKFVKGQKAKPWIADAVEAVRLSL
jgi:hypothetical protein